MSVLDLLPNQSRTIRIPDSRSVILPAPFAKLVDHPDFQRLRRVRQLGPTHLVYPGAVHTRFEHSLGVFWAAAAYLDGLTRHGAIRERIADEDVRTVLAAALLHDIGHYPYAHSLEALHNQVFEAPRHEDLAAEIITGQRSVAAVGPTVAELLVEELKVEPSRVAALVQHGSSPALTAKDRLLASIINSAIDADKLDYLERDSLHMGVPYGRMPDRVRLTESLTINPSGNRIALTEKGRVSGEIFLFSRYLMFSEAYWHHTVRAASAMIEHALADYINREQPDSTELTELLLGLSDDELLGRVRQTAGPDSTADRLLEGLSSNTRGLYKRLLTLSRQRENTRHYEAYDLVYPMDREALIELTNRLRKCIERSAGCTIHPSELLIDTPPRDKDKPDTIDVVFHTTHGDEALPLHTVSRVVGGITNDFTQVVKKIRVFAHPRVRERLEDRLGEVEEALLAEILECTPSARFAGSSP